MQIKNYPAEESQNQPRVTKANEAVKQFVEKYFNGSYPYQFMWYKDFCSRCDVSNSIMYLIFVDSISDELKALTKADKNYDDVMLTVSKTDSGEYVFGTDDKNSTPVFYVFGETIDLPEVKEYFNNSVSDLKEIRDLARELPQSLYLAFSRLNLIFHYSHNANKGNFEKDLESSDYGFTTSQIVYDGNNAYDSMRNFINNEFDDVTPVLRLPIDSLVGGTPIYNNSLSIHDNLFIMTKECYAQKAKDAGIDIGCDYIATNYVIIDANMNIVKIQSNVPSDDMNYIVLVHEYLNLMRNMNTKTLDSTEVNLVPGELAFDQIADAIMYALDNPNIQNTVLNNEDLFGEYVEDSEDDDDDEEDDY